MKSDYGIWSFPMVWLDGPTFMVWFLEKISGYKAFGPLTGCEPIMNQERNDHAQKEKKKDVMILSYMSRKDKFWKETQSLTIVLYTLVCVFSSPKKVSFNCYCFNISLPWAPKHLGCLFQHKTRWTMSVDNVGLKYVVWGPQTPRSF